LLEFLILKSTKNVFQDIIGYFKKEKEKIKKELCKRKIKKIIFSSAI
jgi:hypothetical protein